MRIQAVILVAGLSALAPFMAYAAEPDSVASTPMTPAVQEASADQVVCNYFFHEGAVVRRPTCLTRGQWERRRLEMQRSIIEYQIRSLTKDN
jgi:hypothetical protein